MGFNLHTIVSILNKVYIPLTIICSLLHKTVACNTSYFSLAMVSSAASTMEPSNSTSSIKFRPPLLQSKPALAVFYLGLLVIVSSFGVITNPISFIIHYKNQKLNKVGRIFLMNLSVADMCVNCISLPACAIGVIKGEEFFRSRSAYCRFVGSLCFLACVCAILNLTMATTNRYFFLCHNQTCGKIFNRRYSLSAILMVWLISLMLESANMFGLGGHRFDFKQHSCVWNRISNHTYTLFVTLVLILSPLLAVGVLNLLILRKIHKTKMDICKLNDTHSIRGKRSWLAETLRTSRTIFLLFMVFIVCWIPYVFVIAVDPNNRIQEEVYLFVALLVHMHSSSGFLVYWIGSKEFVKAVKRLLNRPFPDSNTKQIPIIYGIPNYVKKNSDKSIPLRRNKQISRVSTTSNTNSSFIFNPNSFQHEDSNLEE